MHMQLSITKWPALLSQVSNPMQSLAEDYLKTSTVIVIVMLIVIIESTHPFFLRVRFEISYTLYAFSTYLCHAFKDQKVNFVLLECTSYDFNGDSCEVMTWIFNEEICDRSCRHHLLNSDFLGSKFRGSLRECDIQDTILHRCLDFLVLWKGYYQTESI